MQVFGGLGGIGDQVREHLPQLIGIPRQGRQPALVLGVEEHALLVESSLGPIHGGQQQAFGADPLQGRRLRPGVGEHIREDGLHVGDLLAGDGAKLFGLTAGGGLLAQDLQGDLHGREGIAQVVSDHGRHASHLGQGLGAGEFTVAVRHLPFQALALGDVLADGRDPDRATLRVSVQAVVPGQ